MFDPALAGYWGDDDLDEAGGHVLALIADHAERIDGIKVSLLDARSRASRSARRCRPACASTRATTSTTPS